MSRFTSDERHYAHDGVRATLISRGFPVQFHGRCLDGRHLLYRARGGVVQLGIGRTAAEAAEAITWAPLGVTRGHAGGWALTRRGPGADLNGRRDGTYADSDYEGADVAFARLLSMVEELAAAMAGR